MGLIDQILGSGDIQIVAFCVTVYCLLGLLFYNLFKIAFGKITIKGDSYYGVTIIGTLVSVNAVLLIFVLVQSVSTVQQINGVVKRELETIYSLERVMAPLQSESMNQIKPYLKAYLTSIVNREWAFMKTTERDEVTEQLLDDLVVSIKAFSPQNVSESKTKEDLKGILKDMIEARFYRLKYKGKNLAEVFYYSVFFMQILLVFHFFILTSKTAFSQLILTIHMATLGTLFGLVLVYDRPFEGRSGIHASEFSPMITRLDDLIGGEYNQ